MSDKKTEAEVVAEIAREQTLHDYDTLAAPFMVIPRDSAVDSLERLLPKPTRIKQSINIRTLESFIDYLKWFGVQDTSIIKSDPKNTKFQAIIDYHSDHSEPEWCDHIVNYDCEFSHEWQIWQQNDSVRLEQADFADFLEERAPDVVTPTGSELMEIALKFHVIRKAVFGKQIRLSSGEIQFQYSEDNQKGTVEVPEEIEIGVAPFHNGEIYRVKARFRYRISDGVLTFSYHMINPDKIIEHAFKEMVDKIKDADLGLQMYETVL